MIRPKEQLVLNFKTNDSPTREVFSNETQSVGVGAASSLVAVSNFEASDKFYTPTQFQLLRSSILGFEKKSFSFEMSPKDSLKKDFPFLEEITRIQIEEKIAKSKPIQTNSLIETKKNSPLSNLFTLLMQLFLNETENLNDVNLKPIELEIFNFVIDRKFKLRFDSLQSLSKEENQNLLINSFRQVSNKRKEENFKFIYKMTVKKMMRSFEEQNNLIRDENTKFFSFYFLELAEKFEVGIDAFFDPSSQRANNKIQSSLKFKSINHDFLKIVFSSQIFKNEFKKTLGREDFVDSYKQNMYKKMEKLLLKWSRQIKKQAISSVQKKLMDYFNSAKKCKLPWTLYEVEIARRCFANLDILK